MSKDEEKHTYTDLNNNVVDIYDANKNIIKPPLPENIEIQFKGKNSHVRLFISDKIRKLSFILGDDSSVEFGNNISVCEELRIILLRKNDSVIVGNNTFFGNCTIFGDEPNITFSIGENCFIGFGVSMRVGDGHTIYDVTSLSPINIPKDVKIADHVWIGRDVVLLKGATVPQNSVVGIRSVVTKSFDKPNCIYAGVPAKIVKQNINWSHSAVCDYIEKLRSGGF